MNPIAHKKRYQGFFFLLRQPSPTNLSLQKISIFGIEGLGSFIGPSRLLGVLFPLCLLILAVLYLVYAKYQPVLYMG